MTNVRDTIALEAEIRELKGKLHKLTETCSHCSDSWQLPKCDCMCHKGSDLYTTLNSSSDDTNTSGTWYDTFDSCLSGTCYITTRTGNE